MLDCFPSFAVATITPYGEYRAFPLRGSASVGRDNNSASTWPHMMVFSPFAAFWKKITCGTIYWVVR